MFIFFLPEDTQPEKSINSIELKIKLIKDLKKKKFQNFKNCIIPKL